ncbi:hypothetical protein ACLB2K_035526 [Fragaria x ananassa]
MSRAGGICLLWKEDVEVSLLSFSKNHIDVWVGGVNSASRWRFTGLYGFSKAEDRHKTWALLRELGSTLNALKVSHLKPSKSDHLSILVEIRSVQVEVRRKKKRWRFEGYWLQDEECGEMVRRGWQSSECVNDFMKVCQKINNTRKVLGEWSKLKFGILKKEIELTRSKLAVFYEKAQGSYREEECKVLQDKLNDLHLHEHHYWKQRAKVMWLVDGDQNTSYFHQKVCNRKRKNTIKGLFNEEGVWCSRDSELEEIVLGYYGSLFTTSSPIIKAVWCFMNSEELMREVNETHVTLILKVKELEYITQLRPISLCNVIYKLRSKVLSNRLKPLLDLMIAPNQSAFVPGRQIADNSLLAYEVSHHLKRLYNAAHGFGALKLDMSKAYDRVEWDFLERVMQNMGFHNQWIKWIMDCLSTVSYSFILNGEPRGRLIPSRGLRQGDSISPYLFLLCVEGLSRMLTYAKRRGFIHGVVVAPGAPSINHLFFANDSFVFMRAEEEECTRIGWQLCLELSELASTRNIWGFLPRCMVGFWWGDFEKGKKIHWLAWERLCASKEDGGLGFQNMELFNQALLAKQVWRLMQQPDSLASRVLRAKYYSDGSILLAKANSGASYAWRSLVKGKELLSKGIRYQIGSGSDVSVWQDPWIPRPYTFRPYSGMMEGLEKLKVADLIDPDNREWMRDWLEELFFANEVELIMRIPLSKRNREDKLVWHFDRHGLYYVRSGYHVARRLRLEQIGGTSSVLNSNSSLWKRI